MNFCDYKRISTASHFERQVVILQIACVNKFHKENRMKNNNYMCFQHDKHWFKHALLIHVIFTQPFEEVLLLSSFHICEYWGAERLSHLAKATQLSSYRTGIETQADEFLTLLLTITLYLKRSGLNELSYIAKKEHNSWANKMININKN